MDFTVDSGGVELSGAQEGSEGPALCLLHGLTATRRYVVHGSGHLARKGHRVIAYDARGHGRSGVGAEGTYGYVNLADDAAAVLEARVADERVVLAGHSMGAHTAAALALRDPGRLAGLVVIGPAVTGQRADPDDLAAWDRLADGLARGGVEGFIEAYDRDLDPEWRETLLRITRERLQAHEHPEAVARALREVPRSAPFEDLEALGKLELPALVVASHDDADPGHPHEVAKAWARALPQAEVVSEDPGSSPLAWQGGKLSREIEAFCASEAVRERLQD